MSELGFVYDTYMAMFGGCQTFRSNAERELHLERAKKIWDEKHPLETEHEFFVRKNYIGRPQICTITII